ncbi:MAG: hypothetical protein Kow0077_00800 [Anaerolineae bacterium]
MSRSDSPFIIESVGPGVYAVIDNGQGTAVGNAGIIDLGGGTLVFDTLLTPRAAQALRAAATELTGSPVRWVVNSHYHNDHIRGNQVFVPDATVISTRKTYEQIQHDGVEELKSDASYAPRRAAELEAELANTTDSQARKQITFWLDYFRAITESLDTLELTLPDITFEHYLHLHGSRRTVILHGDWAGHTASDAVLVVPDAGVAFLADLLFVKSHPFLADGNPLTLMDSLQQLQKLDVQTFVPGHGPVGTAADLEAMIAYLDTCMVRARALVKAGASPDDLTNEPVPDPFIDWAFPHFYGVNLRFLHGFFSSHGS